MCRISIHLLIGALLVSAVKNEVTTMINSTENTTAPFSEFNTTTHFEEMDNITTPSYTITLPNSTVVNSTSDGKSESRTPPPSKHPQTISFTTDDSLKTVSQSSTNNMIRSTTTSTATTTQAAENVGNNGTTYIIIFIIAVLCLAGVVLYCCLKKKSRRYSVDLHPKQEDAQIPLSTVDIEVFDTTSVKDMHTFTPVESTEPLKDPTPVKEAEKPDEEKESTDAKEENQQNLASTEATGNPKDKMEGLTIVDLNDGEPSISTKTSMESLDDVLNENNSNNTRAEDL
ncbi:uncharacterized protein si:dkey-27h10.2 isoform X2 [Puntigrus tetrazona]|uniref:uncharacterized protein si:dkey-27h10.2 isoform X2 n=1 Tax=Puntigrus tetrazona TaxID=1606681 RepID=UPI001C8AF455|nr:uncharacterized protein si:dkey-27h10.2 isoform X2 [Puntigrus tetrazona]